MKESKHCFLILDTDTQLILINQKKLSKLFYKIKISLYNLI